MAGLRVELKISPDFCPVVEATEQVGVPVDAVNRTTSDDGETVVEEVVFEDDVDEGSVDFDQIFEHDDFSVYEFNRSVDGDCVCDDLEAELGRPVSDIGLREDNIYITVHVEDLEALRNVIESLREQCDVVSVSKIHQPDADLLSDPVVFDRNKLTSRQMEVFEVAHEMGYFDHPKEANAGDVAEELGIAVSTFSEHISATQSKIAKAVLELEQ